jgi:hypothetical protein
MDLNQLFSINQKTINIQLYFKLRFLLKNNYLISISKPNDSAKGNLALMLNKLENSLSSSYNSLAFLLFKTENTFPIRLHST